MDPETWATDILMALHKKIEAKGSGVCMGCLADTPTKKIASLGIYVPTEPGILGKTRVVGYPLCLECMDLPDDKLSKAVEGNIIRAGVMLDPREFRLEDIREHNP